MRLLTPNGIDTHPFVEKENLGRPRLPGNEGLSKQERNAAASKRYREAKKLKAENEHRRLLQAIIPTSFPYPLRNKFRQAEVVAGADKEM